MDLLNVAKWLHNNKLTLNLDKTRSMLIGSNKRLSGIVSFSLTIFESNVKNVHSFKYLGIKLSANFTWTDHTEYISSKINKNLSLLRRIKHLLPLHGCIRFYNSFIVPIFDYADLVWGDKDNVTLMAELQGKIILDRPLHSRC